MKKKLTFFLILLLSFFSCSKKIISENKIPFKYNDYIYLNVSVNKINNNCFIFDTGWLGIGLDSVFCEEVGIEFSKNTIEINGIGNLSRRTRIITDTIFFSLNNNYTGFSNFSIGLDLKRITGKKVDGIAGITIFSQKPYMIDYVSQNIKFTNSVEGYEELNALFEDNKIYIPLTITLKNKIQIKGKFMLDTGSNRTILNNHNFIGDSIFNSPIKKKYYSKGGVGGDSNGFLLQLEEVNVGKFNLKNIIVSLSSDTLGALANPNYMGIIGNDILDDFHIILDHQKEKIWVKPNKNFNKNKRKLFRGISFQDNGKNWVVVGIVEETEAFRQGIRMNDQIIQVNNVPVEQIDLDKFVDKLKANDILKLKIKRDGEAKEIKFKLNVFLKS
ncbi:PDZ domain-containing protein [Flavobacterium sp.]|jgi:hypothetical protein|uniref:PDZ domain-containing protein n=1 Tax=Flavobacterium sp. TaxID=239 RepID=UPI0037C02B29